MCAIVKPRPAMLKWGMVERAVIILHLAEAKYTDGKMYWAIWTNRFGNLDKYILWFEQILFAVWMGNAQVRNGGASSNTPLGGGWIYHSHHSSSLEAKLEKEDR